MLTKEQITRLLDIAGAATHKGLTAQARRIYEGVLADRPGFVPALIGLAFNHMTVDQFGEAEDILRNQVLAKNPGDADALAYLGLCLRLEGRTDEARAVLESVPADAASARAMADRLLEA